MKTTGSGWSSTDVTNVAMFAAPDWSSAHPAGPPTASVIGPDSGRPALRRHSTALHTRVAATARSSVRSRWINSASANCSAVSSPCQSSALRSRTVSTSQPTFSAPATASVRPAPCEEEIAMPSSVSCGLPSPRWVITTGRSSIRSTVSLVCLRLASLPFAPDGGSGSTAHRTEVPVSSAACRSR